MSCLGYAIRTAAIALRLLYAAAAVTLVILGVKYLGASIGVCDPPAPPMYMAGLAYLTAGIVSARLTLTGDG